MNRNIQIHDYERFLCNMNNQTSMIKHCFVHYDRFEFIVYYILLPLHEFRSLTLLQELLLQEVVMKHKVKNRLTNGTS